MNLCQCICGKIQQKCRLVKYINSLLVIPFISPSCRKHTQVYFYYYNLVHHLLLEIRGVWDQGFINEKVKLVL